MSIGAFKPNSPFTYLRIVVGQGHRKVKAKQATTRSRKSERSAKVKPPDLELDPSASENSLENRSTNGTRNSTEKLKVKKGKCVMALNLNTMVEEKNNSTRHKRASLSRRSTRDQPKFDPDKLTGYNWSGTQKYYITAEFTPEQVEKGIVFVLGDGKYYARYGFQTCVFVCVCVVCLEN